MQSPPIEWTLAGVYIAALDFLRNQGEEDGDTLSESVRTAVDRLGPYGPLIFTLALYGSAEVFRRHILRGRRILRERS